MITPDQFNSIDETIDEVNLKKLELVYDWAPNTGEKLKEPNDVTIAAINEDRDELEEVESVEELFTSNKINIGSKVVITHSERQEMREDLWCDRPGVDVGEAE